MPPNPHVVEVSPCWQLPVASQQPFGQFEALHWPQVPASQAVTTWQKPSLQKVCAPQTAHAAPSSPHAPELPPAWQFPEESQQPPQVSGPHDVWISQPPSKQVPPGPQGKHCWPPSPQAEALVPDTQLSPRQQPEQFCAVHAVDVPQTPDGRHVVPLFWQFWHAWPPVPHACELIPVMQTCPSGVLVQQPFGHVVGSHPDMIIVWQVWVDASQLEGPPWLTQERQSVPPEPQSSSVVPVSQRFVVGLQHPPGQVSGPQSVAVPQVRVERLQTAPVEHTEHVRPPRPQSDAKVPVSHRPASSQQPPAQVSGPHARAPSMSAPPSIPGPRKMAERSPQPALPTSSRKAQQRTR